MLKLSRLAVKGFQSHKDSELEFHPGFNVIVGPNDSGKSAVIRALRKVCFDDPNGADFVNDEMDECSIELELDNGTVLRREVEASRDKDGFASMSGHRYVVNGEKFESFGKSVPDEVYEAHGMVPLSVSKNAPDIDLNFQMQHDPAFLLFESGPTRAKAVSYVSGVDVMDRAVQEVNRRKRKASAERSSKTADIESLEEEISKLPSEKQTEETLGKLRELKGEASSSTREWEDLVQKRSTASEIRTKTVIAKTAVEAYQGFSAGLQKLLDSVEESAEELEKLLDLKEEIDAVREKLDSASGDKVRYEEELEETSQQIDDLLSQLSECPYCGTELTGDAKEHLLHEEGVDLS